MKLLFSVFIAAFYGVAVRMLAGLFSGAFEIMSLSFFVLVPFAIGYLTLWLLPYKHGQSATGAFFKPSLVCLVILIVTVFGRLEGMICWVMAFPLFAICAGIGGVIAFKRKERRFSMKDTEWDFEKGKWNEPGGFKISLVLLIPILAGYIEGNRMWEFREMNIERSVVIPAAPARVWAALTAKQTPRVKSGGWGVVGMLGFPHHLETSMDSAVAGGKRVARYEKGLVIEQKVKALDPGKGMDLSITTDPTAISAAVMDEHIVIGGEHIKMAEDSYRLELMPGGGTKVSLASRFSIRTPFNWYAAIWAHWMMSDVLSGELNSLNELVMR